MSLRSLVVSALSALVTLRLAAAPAPPPAPSPEPEYRGFGAERVGVRGGEPTEAGVFDGTWMYVNRDSHYAMWIRTKEGRTQVRMQYQSLASPESFETDWEGKASYFMGGQPVTFGLAVVSADAAEISGHWAWNVEIGNDARRETADVTLHRTGYGRTFVMRFNNFEKTVRRNGVDNVVRVPMSWAWIKVSKRELLWDELPW